VADVYGGRKTFDKFWKGFDSWYKQNDVYPGFPEGINSALKDKILLKSPQNWLKEAGALVASTLDDWKLMRVELMPPHQREVAGFLNN